MFVLIDASVPLQPADMECLAWLVDARVPFAVIFTKIDKRKKRCPRPEENMKAFEVGPDQDTGPESSPSQLHLCVQIIISWLLLRGHLQCKALPVAKQKVFSFETGPLSLSPGLQAECWGRYQNMPTVLSTQGHKLQRGPLSLSPVLQAAFRGQYQNMPMVLSTSAQRGVGRTELLTHIARLRNLNSQQSGPQQPSGVEPDEWEGLAE